ALGAGFTYQWYKNDVAIGGATSNSYTTGALTLAESGDVYKVVVTDTNNSTNCTGEDSGTLTVNANPAPSVDDEAECEGDPATFMTANLGAGFTYQWYLNDVAIGGATSNSYTTGALTLAEDGDVYKVVVTDTNNSTNCTGEDSGTLSVNPLPIVEAGDSPEPLCSDGGSVQLTGSPLGGTWSGSPYITSDGLFTVPDGGISAGDYEVTYTYQDGNGCSDSDTVIIPVVDCTDCGTAFGVALNDDKSAIDELVLDGDGNYVSGTSRCFREDSFRRWGWTNAINPSADPYILDLYRGAGRCLLDKGEYVGYVTVNYGLDNIITVEFTPKDGDTGFDEIHLYVGCDPYPTNKSGAYTVAPGQYTFTDEGNGFAEGWSTSTDAEKTITVPGGGMVYVIAHVVACTDYSEERAPNGFVPRTGYGEFQGDAPTPGEMDCEVVVDPWSKTSDANVTAYPVPFTDQINLNYMFEYETDVNINVYDMKGALIRHAEDRNYTQGTIGKTTIDLSRADDQMYFIRLTTSKESAIRKIISAKPQ
ncbi:T9SS type A sorting domain-containing protein, partial [Flavisericum labens]|uniref:T9SS type A sorting domain-containing protein n=1 Tax=Flavisericum labens TaxID=3377112 RepID=UPI00387AE784